jgi:hypothetical protein
MSSPPSETPSPAADDHAEKSQQPSIEQLFAVLEREIYEGRSQTPKPSTLLARESGAEPTDNWAYQELEKFISEELSATEDASGIEGLVPREDMASREEVFSMQHSEYVVEENGPETEVLSVDDSDDARSIPLDMLEVVETIQLYEVEEPETGCLTDVGVIQLFTFVTDDTQVSETAIQVSNDEDSTALRIQPAVSSPESVSTPVLEHPVLSASAPRSEGTLQASLPSAAEIIPAPTVADPSVPDPVMGDSLPTSYVPTDPYIAPRLSLVPPVKAYELEPSQISTGISGLFTPAQRSGVGTPVLLEDETAEAVRTPDDESNTGLLASSTPPADSRPSSDKHGEEDGGNAEDEDLVWPDNSIEALGPLSPNAHQLGATVVDVDAQNPNPRSVEIDDDISSTPRDGSVEPVVSPPLLTGDTSGTSLKYSDRPDVLASGGELHPDPGTDTAEGDEDADGEADPDYPQEDAADVAVESEVASSKVGSDTRSCAEIVPNPENHPAR